MMLFAIALLLLVTAVVLFTAPVLVAGNRALGLMGAVAATLAALVAIAFSTAIYVNDDQGGIVIRKFGADLPPNRVVAEEGQKGPQARMLGPGWHFGYWPWLYNLNQVETVAIEQGHVGVVVALDGKPPSGTDVFAPKWESSEAMLDGEGFLKSDKGHRGPQLTVVTPGRYRFNPRLFTVTSKLALTIGVGEVAVIKANAGPRYVPKPGEELTVINGTALVPNEFQGIWKQPLPPGAYNLHPDAYQVVKVQTTNRIYTYQDKKWAIRVRSKDGFTFPVDVRVSVSVSAEEAPYLVALLANPDLMTKDEQEDDTLSVLEAKVILPLVRTIIRNVAETMNALQFVSSRTQVEATASQSMRDELKKYRLDSEGVFIGNIDLDETEAGKQLLLTQTDREVAVNQQATFAEKKRAEEARATFVKAEEEAAQQRQLAQATYKVQVAEQEAKAREAEAKGEASYITITAEAKQKAYTAMAGAIGPEGVTTLELMKLISEGKVQITPHVMVGSGGGTMDALAGTILGGQLKPQVQIQPAAPGSAAPAPRK